MKKLQNPYIKCPKCNAEYLPEEIFVSLLNNNYYIQKTEDTHEIIDCDYTGQIEDSYICNYCDTAFKVQCKLSFNSFIDEKFNFNELYSTKLKPTVLLKED